MSASLHRAAAVLALLSVTACGTDSLTDYRSITSPADTRFADSEWSVPVLVGPPVNSAFRELRATLSRDGHSLFFASNRPGGYGGFDLWVSHRACEECPWEEPTNLGATINSTLGEGGAALSVDGLVLVFSGSRPGGFGGEDIWMTRRRDPHDDLGWETPVNLGSLVNTAADETGPTFAIPVAGHEGLLFFSRGGEILQASMSRSGEAREEAVPVAELNHPVAIDAEPTIRGDGRELLFWANSPRGGLGGTDLWVATRRSIQEPWSAPQNAAALNSAFAELSPSISHDGRTILFSAGAARGGLGLQDIWMSTRRP